MALIRHINSHFHRDFLILGLSTEFEKSKVLHRAKSKCAAMCQRITQTYYQFDIDTALGWCPFIKLLKRLNQAVIVCEGIELDYVASFNLRELGLYLSSSSLI